MPLHLLGKKSWNVYNADNIARVRRDEEAARAKEQADEQRQQEVDAERRLAILRGEVPPPLPPSIAEADPKSEHRIAGSQGGESGATRQPRERRKRKHVGEDDTDFEMRVARERTDGDRASTASAVGQVVKSQSSNAPITDATGHIDLFGGLERMTQKNPEAEAEKNKKKRELEDQSTLRFSNAAGFKNKLDGAWYVDIKHNDEDPDRAKGVPGRDVWGNEDLGRKDRDAARIVASDPLAMMKKGAARVREVEKERRAVNEEREKDMRRLRKEEQRREKRRRRDREYDEDGASPDGREHPRHKQRHRDDRGDDDEGLRKHHSFRHEYERRKHRSEHHHHRNSHHKSRRNHESRDRQSDSHRHRRELAKTDNY